MQQANKKLYISSLILIIIHIAGIIGLHTSYRQFFLSLTPVNLLLSAVLLLLNHRNFNRSFFIFSILVLYCGFMIELLGVRTGAIFGRYWYEDTLGWSLWNIPVVIAINWFMIIYSAGIISNKTKFNIYIKSGIGALLLVFLDLLIEQSAMKYHFWAWLDGIIPLRNYIAWFIVSYIFLLLFHSLKFNKDNRLAPVLYVIQLIFFAFLFIF